MKPFLLLAALVAPMLMTSCVVESDVAYRHSYHRYHPYQPYYRHGVVVEQAPVGVVYYHDARGRYYWRHHRRVYANVY